MRDEPPTLVRPRDLLPGDRILFGAPGSKSVVEVRTGPTTVNDTSGNPLDCFEVQVEDGQQAELIFRADADRVRLTTTRRLRAAGAAAPANFSVATMDTSTGDVQALHAQSIRDAQIIRELAARLLERDRRITALEAARNHLGDRVAP